MIRLFNRSLDIPELADSDPAVIAKLVTMFEAESGGRSALTRVQSVQLGSFVFLGVLWWLFRKWVDHVPVSFVVLIATIGAWAIVMGNYGTRVTARIASDFVRFVHERCPSGVPQFCMACSYDLRGSPDGLCPECGTAAPRHGRVAVGRGEVRVMLRGRKYNVPELGGCTEEMRRMLVKRFQREGRGRHGIAVTQLLQSVTLALTVLWVVNLQSVLIALYLLGAWTVAAGVFGNRATKQLLYAFRAYLRTVCSNGRPRICLRCEYDLRGSVGATCPECGAMVPRIVP